ncbi:MAG: ECF-type sigma factor [Myxococcota bacterium]
MASIHPFPVPDSANDAESVNDRYRLVYEELRLLAHRQRRRLRRRDHATLGTTALVHEAYVKLAHRDPNSWNSREHFLATAARAMRQVLVSYARATGAKKRGGDAVRLATDVEWLPDPRTLEDVLELNEALERLAKVEARLVAVVECRVFSGMNLAETASALEVSISTVKRDWTFATAWLYRALQPHIEGAREGPTRSFT